jgi:hypothetical protein
MDINLTSHASKKAGGFKNKKQKAGTKQPAYQVPMKGGDPQLQQHAHHHLLASSCLLESATASPGTSGAAATFSMGDVIDNIVMASAANLSDTSFRRADKTKEISEMIANWTNPAAYISQLEGANRAKSIIISNLALSNNPSAAGVGGAPANSQTGIGIQNGILGGKISEKLVGAAAVAAFQPSDLSSKKYNVQMFASGGQLAQIVSRLDNLNCLLLPLD